MGIWMQRMFSCLEEAEELNSLKAPYFFQEESVLPTQGQFFFETSLPFIPKKNLLIIIKQGRERFLEIFICS